MKLLIITQAVDQNNPALGFFHRWIEEFAQKVSQVEVICLSEGKHVLPANVRVHSLGKKSHVPVGFYGRIKYLYRFYSLVWRLRESYDTVFVHMNPIYIVLAGCLWRMQQKYVALWYTHKKVDWKLRLAEKIVDLVFTASKESFRLDSKKVIITGHGIDTNHFVARTTPLPPQLLRILTVGRISPIKNIHSLLEALFLVREKGFPATLTIVGAPATKEDVQYQASLHAWVIEHELTDTVTWVGAVAHNSLPSYFASHDLFVSLSDTGSFDKAVAEALASGLPVLTSNSAFGHVAAVSFIKKSELVDRIISMPSEINSVGRSYIVDNHSLARLIPVLVSKLESQYIP